MNLPNKLTLLRILLVPLFVAFSLIDFRGHYFAAALVFVIASVTDCLDGYIARKHNLVTDFGKFLDPLADKVLVTAALMCMLFKSETIFSFLEGWGSVWQLFLIVAVIIIVSREFMVSGLRLVTAGKGVVVPADIWGKLKTAFTMVAIVFIYLFMELCEKAIIPFSQTFFDVGVYISFALIAISTILTIISGVRYLWQMRNYLDMK
ncbi:MAG: CDP-alcohol phosphatidyltransferase family protein [Oscillospiraceae bacterium]|nr:CDP-alcohol phosphatidyltransferase family protein [Oscillospiraceae bacterium]